jgi:hypothetical protein
MEKEMVNSLLNKIGKAFFVKYLIDTIENNVNFTEISKKEDISVSSCYTRISNIKRIIRENKTNTALEVCIDSKRFSKINLKKIQELLGYINKLQNSQNKKMKNIEFLPNTQFYTDLSCLNELETIKLYADVVNELKIKGIIRSAKVTGDLGEHFVVNYFNKQKDLPDLKLKPNKSNTSYDAVEINDDKIRYEIKTITQNQTSNISYTDGSPSTFDFLIICKLDKNYYVEKLYRLTFDEFQKVKKSKNNSYNTWYVKIDNKEFLNLIDAKPQIAFNLD